MLAAKQMKLGPLGLIIGLLAAGFGLRAGSWRGDGHQEKSESVGVPAKLFPPLQGPYRVGTHDFFWVDQNRPEPYTSDPSDKRHLMVQVWYPAEEVPGAEFSPYISNPKEFGEWKDYEKIAHVQTRSVLDAPLSRRERRYPVLIYNHGGSWTRFSSSYQTETLASHGYIVFSIDHTGFNLTNVFPDGYKMVNDALKMPEPKGKLYEDALENWEYLGGQPFSTWVKDIVFMLDKLQELNSDSGSRFRRRMDLKKIGALGWSFGGAASVQAAKDDRRLKAVADCDGQLFGNVRETGIAVPVMLMHGEPETPPGDKIDPEEFRRLLQLVRGWDESFLAASRRDRYELTVKGARHGHFSDLVLFYPQSPQDIAAQRGHEIMNAYSVAFFDRYLKGKGGGLLKQIPSPYPEVDFSKK